MRTTPQKTKTWPVIYLPSLRFERKTSNDPRVDTHLLVMGFRSKQRNTQSKKKAYMLPKTGTGNLKADLSKKQWLAIQM